jgi:hypothetical protein
MLPLFYERVKNLPQLKSHDTPKLHTRDDPAPNPFMNGIWVNGQDRSQFLDVKDLL